VTALLVLLGVGCAAALGVLFRRNAREQRAMNEAYDLWRTTGEAVPGWDRHYAWSEPLPVDEPGWIEPSQPGVPRAVRSTPPPLRLRPEVSSPDLVLPSRWDESGLHWRNSVPEGMVIIYDRIPSSTRRVGYGAYRLTSKPPYASTKHSGSIRACLETSSSVAPFLA
jgi:hypothetical protein